MIEEKMSIIEPDGQSLCPNCGEEYEECGYDMCDHCWEAESAVCPVCEEYFDAPQEPQEHRFVLPDECREIQNLPAGLYQALRFPFWSDSILGGDFRLDPKNIVLLRAFHCPKHPTEFLCPTCVRGIIHGNPSRRKRQLPRMLRPLRPM